MRLHDEIEICLQKISVSSSLSGASFGKAIGYTFLKVGTGALYFLNFGRRLVRKE